jgi:hypothetical protein
MRRGLLRGVAAASMAVALGVVGTVRPAQADDVPCEYVVVCPPEMPAAGPMVDFFFAIYNLVKGGPTAANLQALIQATIGALSRATNEVIVHIDSILAQLARSNALNAAIEFADFNNLIQDDLGLDAWAQKIGEWANNSAGTLNVQGLDRRAADQIGHALNEIYPIALAAYRFAGRTNGYGLLKQAYIEANEKIIRDFAPTCTETFTPLAPPSMRSYERRYACVAADGGTSAGTEFYLDGVLQGPALNKDQIKVDAAAHSSWLVAVRILPTLKLNQT